MRTKYPGYSSIQKISFDLSSIRKPLFIASGYPKIELNIPDSRNTCNTFDFLNRYSWVKRNIPDTPVSVIFPNMRKLMVFHSGQGWLRARSTAQKCHRQHVLLVRTPRYHSGVCFKAAEAGHDAGTAGPHMSLHCPH